MEKLILVFLFLLLLLPSPLMAAPLTQDHIGMAMHQMEQGDQNGLEFVLQHSEAAPTFLLLMGAKVAMEKGAVEDAAFLFFAGAIRFQIDVALFPVEGEDDQIARFLDVAGQTIGTPMNPELLANRYGVGRVIGRLERWRPDVSDGYSPGWRYRDRWGAEEKVVLLDELKSELLASPRNLQKLLSIQRYQENLRVVLHATAKTPRDPAANRELARAQQVLVDIEREMNLPALFYRSDEGDEVCEDAAN